MNRAARNPKVEELAKKLAGLSKAPTAPTDSTDNPEERALEILRRALRLDEEPSEAKANHREGPKDLYAIWLTKAKPGDQFIDFLDLRNFNIYGQQARNYGRKVRSETQIAVGGPKSDPTVRSIVVTTMLEDHEQSDSTSDPGADGDSNT